MCNPFGVLYNPLSIASCLTLSIDGQHLDDRMLVRHDGLWHSWLHHTSLSHPDRDTCLQQCNERIDATHRFLQECDTLIITWGTAYAYYLNTHPDNAEPLHPPLLVANCHKVAAHHFNRHRLSVDEIVNYWQPLLQRLSQLPRKPRIIFTVSPIRHLSDGAHGNQLSKATLHLALDQIISEFGIQNSEFRINYFPAYEIMMDELRDYRYYERDMLHPSNLAVDLIWQRFQQTFLQSETIEKVQYGEKAFRQSQHRTISKTINGGSVVSSYSGLTK